MRLWLLANPNAGNGRCARLLPGIRAWIEAAGHEVRCHISRSPEHLTALSRDAIGRGIDAVIACGGDGTAHYVLQSLVHSGVALGIIPVGTGNDVATGLGVPSDLRAACSGLSAGRIRPVDVARAGSRWFVSVAGVGFSSVVNRIVNERSRRWSGRAAYLGAVLRSLRKFEPQPVEIAYDSSRFTGDAMLVAVGNTTSFGGGLKIVPEAKFNDGWLDLCIVKRAGKLTLLRNLPLLPRGGHVNHPAVEIHRARRVAISSPEPIELFADGEYLRNLPVTIEVVPGALRAIAHSS